MPKEPEHLVARRNPRRTSGRVVAMSRVLRYACRMSRLRKLLRAKQHRSKVEKMFARRAERFQTECGWCGKAIGEDDPVVAVGGRVHQGIDLSLVQGKVVELAFALSSKTILVAVAGFESDAKAEGKDVVFMVCSGACGRQIQTAFAEELSHGLTIH